MQKKGEIKVKEAAKKYQEDARPYLLVKSSLTAGQVCTGKGPYYWKQTTCRDVDTCSLDLDGYPVCI